MSGRPAEVSAALTTRKKVDGVTTSLHRWQVTNVPIHHTEQSGDGGLVRGNRIEIANFTAPVGLCGRSCPQSVVALPGLAKAAVIAAMSTKSREVIFGSRIRGAKNRAEGAREEAAKAIHTADRAEAEAWSIQMEGYGGPAQPSPTIGQCLRLRLARGRMQSLQDPREPAARCDQASAQYADLETGGGAEMPVVQERPIRAASSHDQADPRAGDHTLRLGSS